MRSLILFLLFLSSYSLFAQELCLVSDNQQLQELFRAVRGTVSEVQECLDVDALISIIYDSEQPLEERNAQVERLNSLPEGVRPLSFTEAAIELCGESDYITDRDRVESELRVFRNAQSILPPEARLMKENQLRSFLRENQDIHQSLGGREGSQQYIDVLNSGYGTLNPLIRAEEFIIIRLYTRECYRGINRVLRQADPYRLYRYMNLFSTLNNLINRLPTHRRGVLRRWTDLPPNVLAEHTVGNIVRYAAVTSTTSRRDRELEVFGCYQFVIEGGSPRSVNNLSLSSQEREVIYPPGQCFLVTRRRMIRDEDCGRDAYIIHMRAVSCSTPPERGRRR